MLTTPVVTALRKAGRGRVSVELDGSPWRVLPVEPVLAAGLSAGVPLDRARARRLRAELRRVEARSTALSALSRTDHTTATLRDRLAARGVAPADREAALETVRRAGLVDDARFARGRASALAGRGAGNALIRDDLERRGVAAQLIAEAIAGLEPEPERARRVVVAHGSAPRTLRRLAAKGFAEDVLDGLIADQPGTELG
jgi:SOS response regulatory protein OraA/RecX